MAVGNAACCSEGMLHGRPAALPQAITAPRRVFASAVAGQVSYYEDDTASGPPVVLLHGIGPAGSSYEVRGMFEALRGRRAVLAPDLPGYGFSDRPSSALDRETYRAVLEELLTDVVRRYGAALDLVAIGRTGSIAAAMVARTPRLVRSLVVIAPEGFAQPTAIERAVAHVAKKAARDPMATFALHRLATSRPLLRRVLGLRVRTRADEGLVRYVNAAAHQVQSSVAPVAALAELGAHDAGALFEAVRVPVCFIVGDGDHREDGAVAALASRRGFSRRIVRSTRALPHLERALMTTETMQAFWKTLTPRPKLRLIRGGGLGTPALGAPRRKTGHVR